MHVKCALPTVKFQLLAAVMMKDAPQFLRLSYYWVQILRLSKYSNLIPKEFTKVSEGFFNGVAGPENHRDVLQRTMY